MIKYNNYLNNIKIQPWTKGGKKMDISSELDKIIEIIKGRVEREIPDKGFFRDFAENLEAGKEPDFFGSNIALFVERDAERDGRAFLGVSVLHPQIRMDATSYLMNGDRETILKFLQDPQLKEKLQKNILKLSDSLKDVR